MPFAMARRAWWPWPNNKKPPGAGGRVRHDDGWRMRHPGRTRGGCLPKAATLSGDPTCVARISSSSGKKNRGPRQIGFGKKKCRFCRCANRWGEEAARDGLRSKCAFLGSGGQFDGQANGLQHHCLPRSLDCASKCSLFVLNGSRDLGAGFGHGVAPDRSLCPRST